MTIDYVDYHRYLEERLAQLGRELPGPITGFARLHKKAVEDGALSSKVKEMMALAVSIAVGCEGCIAYLVHDAVKAGATRPELLETIGVGLLTLAPPGSPEGGPALRSGASAGVSGGPGSIYAAHALDTVEQFLPEPEASLAGV
jgi:AhpD family alkylhydroperoxidase